MKWLKDYRIILVGVVAAMVLGGGNARADFTFGEATTTPWPPTNTIGDERIRFSTDELTFYLSSDRADGYGGDDLYVCTRSTTDDPWSEPENLGPIVNSSSNEFNTVITSDGLELYFCSDRPGGYGSNDIWMTKRDTKDSPWSQPAPLDPPTNGSTNAWALQSISSDDLEMFFVSGNIPGGYGGQDIWSVKRVTRDAPWGAPVNAGQNVNSDDWDNAPVLLPDDLTLIFSSARLGGFSTMSSWNFDLWMAKRETKDSPWGLAINLGPEVNTEYSEMSRWISADMRMLYFTYRSWEGIRPGGNVGDKWQAPIIPIIDFDGDRNVDALDSSIMINHWGEDYPLCDIGPMPFGDGVVDVQDLIVLNKYLFEDYPLIAYWMLDETEGSIAYDTYGNHDGAVNGNPSWLPTDGMKGGSLMLDGIDDYVETPFILDPSKGSFSVFAWVYCWMPGQVIISQSGESDVTWLGIDSSGNLMTELVPPRASWVNPRPLVSESVITDTQWHHVGLVWDGSYRALYVDGIEVAKDNNAQNPLDSSEGGLYIGASKDLSVGTLLSGFVDDVRIYKQALNPEEIAALAQ
jgi:hypothetical protein